MENSRSKKAVAASLSLVLALGSVPAVALADVDPNEGTEVVASEQAKKAQKYKVDVYYGDQHKNKNVKEGTNLLGFLSDNYEEKAKKKAPKGQQFIGWTYQNGEHVADDATVKEDVVVYAKYGQEPVEQVQFDVVIEETTYKVTADEGVTYGKALESYVDLAKEAAPSGKQFAGWGFAGSEDIFDDAAVYPGVTLYPKYTDQAKQQVTFYAYIGQDTVTVAAEEGDTYVNALSVYAEQARKAAPEGEEFLGWAYNGSEVVISESDTVHQGVYLKALYGKQVQKHTITVTTGQGESEIATSFQVEDGVAYYEALKPYEQQAKNNAPEGMEFAGWGMYGESGIYEIPVTELVKGDAYVYAMYVNTTYTVSVYGGQGAGTPIEAKKVNKGTNLLDFLSAYEAEAKELAPSNMKFAGWEWATHDPIAADTTVMGDISVYAKYVNVETYVVSLGGYGEDPYTIQEEVEVAEGSNLLDAISAYEADAEAAAPAGKKFAGWTWSDGSVVAEDVTVLSNLSVYASYEDVESYDVHVIYGSDPYNPSANISVKKGSNLLQALAECEDAAKAEAPEGKMLSGWQYSEGVDINAEDTVMGELTVQAKYVDASYAINAFVGYGDAQVQAGTLNVKSGDNLLAALAQDETLQQQAIASAPEGSRFSGWGMYGPEGLVAIDSEMTVGADLYVYAMYAEIVSYEVNIYYGSDEGTPKATPSFEEGSNLLENLEAYTELAKENAPEGKQFKAWGWTDDQGTIPVPADATVTGEGINVYAMYEDAPAPIEKVTVTFVDNFNKTESKVEVNKGEAVAKPADPSCDGYEFTGWSSTLEDADGNPLYTPVDFTQAIEADTTLYAFYTEVEPVVDPGKEKADEPEQKADTADNKATGEKDANKKASESPKTADDNNAAAVAGVGGLAGLMAAAAAVLRRRRSN